VTDHLIAEIARAIVHLNFNEPEQARDVLLVALSDFNFAHEKEIRTGQGISHTEKKVAQGKENSNGNAVAA
jgi:hypothetical protein